ncbi:MAG: peroxide stress protein YaaA, partial [Saprospiraceae bacterium]|nr:peroxide stress protein YaaA [Saprospiraceae bacterium]
MIILLSPAKTLDYSPTEIKDFTQPRFQQDTQRLVGQLKKKSARSLKKLMSISDKLAATNAERYQIFSEEFTTENAKQAALAFKGDVYLGLEAETFDGQDFEFADQHLRILSGLYGLLRPLDLMQPYRLEMGTSLKIGRKKNLYQFWGDKITDLINEDLENSQSDFVLNLASKEYFKAVNVKKVTKPIINIHFREFRKGKFTMISFNAKKARGKMAQLIIK